MSTFVLNAPTEILETLMQLNSLQRNSCMKLFSMFPPRTKILQPPLYTVYNVYLSVVTCAPPPIFIRGGPHAQKCHNIIIKMSFSTLHKYHLYYNFRDPKVSQNHQSGPDGGSETLAHVYRESTTTRNDRGWCRLSHG